VENRDEHNIPGLHTGAVDLFCDPPGADLLRAVLNETRANAAWRSLGNAHHAVHTCTELFLNGTDIR